MRSREFEDVVKLQRIQLLVIWFALVSSIAIYIFVAYTVAGERAQEPIDDILVIALTAAAVLAGVMSLVAPRLLCSDAALRRHMRQADFDPAKAARSSGGLGISSVDKLRALPEREQRVATTAPRYVSAWLAGAALAESVAIFGLVLAFLAGTPSLLIPYAGAGAALLLSRKPNLDKVFERAEELA